jgi:hypothetical protein
MVYRPRRGTYEIDRVIAGVGRVRLRTGTHDRRRALQYEAMLDALPLETIRLLVAGQVSLREVWDAWTTGRLQGLGDVRPSLALVHVGRQWLASAAGQVGVSEYRSRERLLRRLLSRQPEARLADLPALLAALRTDLEPHAAAFNRARAAALALIRDTVGRRHALYAEVADVARLPERRQRARHPCTVAEARAIAQGLGATWGPIWWALCCTGMGPQEYWTDGWSLEREGIVIHGRKRTARERIVPLVFVPPAAQGTRWGLRQALRRLGASVTLYDARRTYARWLDEVGIPGYRQDAYLGHGPKSMRELYRWGELRAWLAEDGAVLRRYVGIVTRDAEVAQ